MPVSSLLRSTAAALYLGAALLSAQTYHPQNIRFTGVPAYAQAELLAAAGLKPGAAVTLPEIKAHGQALMDTGLFSALNYTFDSQNLIYHLTPAETLYRLQLSNLPFPADEKLDARLHALLPLYHGKVPSEGGLNEQVRAALEQILAEQGIKATVQAVTAIGKTPTNPTVISYSILSPEVLIGTITSADGPLDPSLQATLARVTGTPYDQLGSPRAIATHLENHYHDRGYWKAAVQATPQAAVAGDPLRIPFSVSIQPGRQYHLSAIHLDPTLLVAQAAFDKQAQLHPGDIANHVNVVENWHYIARQYHNHGYIKAEIHPQPSYDDAAATVAYQVSVDPGPVYAMGSVSIENLSDDLSAPILAAWKLKTGDTFNEGAIRSFFISPAASPALARALAHVQLKKYTLHPNDEQRTVDVVLRLEKLP